MKIITDLFRKYPSCTGLLCLILLSHLMEPKDLHTPILSMPEEFLPVFFLYVMGMLCYMLFVLPGIQSKNREKITWIVVLISIVILTVLMYAKNPL